MTYIHFGLFTVCFIGFTIFPIDNDLPHGQSYDTRVVTIKMLVVFL